MGHFRSNISCFPDGCFLVLRHGNVEPSSMSYIANQLDVILQAHIKKAKNEGAQTNKLTGTGEEELQEIIKTYDGLCKQIRALELPLNVNSLQGLSPVFRGTEVCYTV